VQKLFAESPGAAALVFTGCGAVFVDDLKSDVLGHPGICLVFGLVVMAMIHIFGNISGHDV
jgi:glycerol uptake facilitator-like aquaporin